MCPSSAVSIEIVSMFEYKIIGSMNIILTVHRLKRVFLEHVIFRKLDKSGLHTAKYLKFIKLIIQ